MTTYILLAYFVGVAAGAYTARHWDELTKDC